MLRINLCPRSCTQGPTDPRWSTVSNAFHFLRNAKTCKFPLVSLSSSTCFLRFLKYFLNEQLVFAWHFKANTSFQSKLIPYTVAMDGEIYTRDVTMDARNWFWQTACTNKRQQHASLSIVHRNSILPPVDKLLFKDNLHPLFFKTRLQYELYLNILTERESKSWRKAEEGPIQSYQN